MNLGEVFRSFCSKRLYAMLYLIILVIYLGLFCIVYADINETFSKDYIDKLAGQSNCFKDTVPSEYFDELLEGQNPSSSCPPTTDSGAQPPFKYPFAYSRKLIYQGGWVRPVTVDDLSISINMAGIQTQLYQGAIRELHWHIFSEWGIVIYGDLRVYMLDDQGRGFVDDLKAGDIWLFPGGFPHSILGTGSDGGFYLTVFNSGMNENDVPFLMTNWMNHVPKEVLAKNFLVHPSTFANLPSKMLGVFPGQLPQSLEEERMQVSKVTGYVPRPYSFHASQMRPNVTRRGGQAKIVDANNFPVTDIAAAIVTLKPGAMRELHWHPNADEWQYYVKGKARMGVFTAGGEARTMDFQAGDVGYVPKSFGHYIENTGGEEVVFVEAFPTPYFEDISLALWLAHTPPLLVDQHIKTGLPFINEIKKTKAVIVP